MSMEVSNEVRVKDEPIFDSQSILQTKEVLAINVKEEVEVKAEEKEFTNAVSIAFLNEETPTTTKDNNPTRSNSKSK